MFKQLLVALDLTEMDDYLLRYVLFLAKKFDTERLYFIHNIKSYDLPDSIDTILMEIGKPLEQLVLEEMNEKVERIFSDSGVKINTIVKQSDSTAHTLTKIASELGVDSIVLGKKNAFKGTGIQVNKILRLTEKSVLLIPDYAHYSISKIIVPVDFSKHSELVINIASDISKKENDDLVPIHVYQLPRWFFPYVPEEKANKSLLESAKKSYQKIVNGTNINVDCQFLSGQGKGIARTIYDYATRNQADFIVIGLKGRNQVTGLQLGSVAAKVSQMEWHVPVLLVR
jgi:nucleotide-binding universal stress UspA family protein